MSCTGSEGQRSLGQTAECGRWERLGSRRRWFGGVFSGQAYPSNRLQFLYREGVHAVSVAARVAREQLRVGHYSMLMGREGCVE